MSELIEYQNALSQAINARQRWLEKSEIGKLKEKLRAFQTAYTSLYALLLRKGLVKEDPYKGEAKVGEIHIPEDTPFSETESMDQLTVRLSNYDNQLDFLVNFYHFNVEFFTLDRIRLVLGLIKYIDWSRLSTTSPSPTTVAVSSLINRTRGGNDSMSTNVLNGILVTLSQLTGHIMADLKVLADFNREAYKLELRNILRKTIPEDKALSVPEIKKAFAAAKTGQPFYAELAEEIIKEDYSPEGPAMRDKVLKAMGVDETKPKTAKQEVSIKPILIEGIQAISSVSSTLAAIGEKFDENETLLEHKKVGLWIKVKRVVGQMLNKEPEPTIYEVEYGDGKQGASFKEKVNFSTLREDMDKRVKNLANVSSRNTAKLETIPDDQLTGFLEKAIRDVRSLHRLLSALDEYFKNAVDKEDRNKVKGIKPELATIKSAFLKANEKFVEYSDLKEEEEQFKRLGIDSGG
ncbi:MAG: hypothetical protein LBD55_02060 [Treponema sp.]|jgi:hypothetical protein|nr:hypothetical protein [Treponema sp.]